MGNDVELKNPWPHFEQVFKIKEKKGKTVKFLCLLCPTENNINAYENSSSNLKKHVLVSIKFSIELILDN